MEKSNLPREQKLELYNKLLAGLPDVPRKGDTIPYTSLNGHMFSFLTKENVVGLRLPVEDRLKFLDKYKTKLVEQYGIVQKEYVVVPDDLLVQTDELKIYFKISYDYTNSLKPKPTSKSKKKD